MEITKEKVEVYKIRGIEMGGWADITIDDNGKRGRISISSSHGDWAYYWHQCGTSFKDFLCGLDIGYISGKFGCSNHFNLNDTIESWKQSVIDERKQEYLSKDEARFLFNEIKEIEEMGPNKEGVKHMLWNTEKLLSFFESSPHLVTEISPSFRFFWDKIWKPFTEGLKKENSLIVEPV